ncbi:arylsulfatase [Altericroceibacterium endophyticum]|uniref:Sulfatase-like hydrolase/transferase n=1 Tax=Altericroceibacterium endophyticum TaxID=1808508 RepID=A0A6I4T3I7_9SPHN|nr:arylsulfatase [Altericroceibacterium endophyticum]MXO64550.1 sulfatase-like hydrolase/transferase [Altericroceibacterium endophyticum]
MQTSRRRFTFGLLSSTMLAPSLAVAKTKVEQPLRRPNIITIVLDDVGFSDLGCFGGEINTPAIDGLAQRGQRFNRFDSKAVCSCTRASLLTGRNSHSVNFPDVPDTAFGPFAKDFPFPTFHLPDTAQTSAQTLQDAGYATWLVGKWHLIPMDHLAPGTSRKNWPRARGFDYFYGFARGWTDQYKPELVENDDYIHPDLPADYHVSAGLVDKSIELIEAHAERADADKPFFLHLGMGVAHSPIQAPAEYSARYSGRYSEGWDVLRERRFERMKAMNIIPANTSLPPRAEDDRAWTDLSEDERVVFARYMEVYAGFIEHADAQLGRLMDCLEKQGLRDDTMIVFLSDNGAASEAGQNGFFEALYQPNTLTPAEQRQRMIELGTVATQSEYPRPWAGVSSAPFRRYKLWPFLGGVRTPLIVSWPAFTQQGGEIRDQYVDVVDLAPTMLEAAGTSFPATVNGQAEMPVAGRSFLHGLRDSKAKGRQRQFFELRGNRAITDGHWRAVGLHSCGVDNYDNDDWQLFDTAEDFSEMYNVADKKPAVLSHMKKLWQQEWDRWVDQPLELPSPVICMLAGDLSDVTP